MANASKTDQAGRCDKSLNCVSQVCYWKSSCSRKRRALFCRFPHRSEFRTLAIALSSLPKEMLGVSSSRGPHVPVGANNGIGLGRRITSSRYCNSSLALLDLSADRFLARLLSFFKLPEVAIVTISSPEDCFFFIFEAL
jgi:hypothetical protein